MTWFTHLASDIYFEDTGSGDTVLLLPGFSDRIENHNTLREVLVRNYRVIAADLPGSGRSRPQPRRYHPAYLEDDAIAFAALLQDRVCGPAHVLGHSDGGEVALLMATLVPGSLRSVLTWGAQGSVSDPDGQIIATFRNAVDNPDPPYIGYRDYLVSSYGEHNARAMTQSFADAITAIEKAGGDICRSRAHKITCPALLLVGQHDPFVSKAVIDELAGRMPIAEVIEVEAAGHGIHEDQPAWFGATVMNWLAEPNQMSLTPKQV